MVCDVYTDRGRGRLASARDGLGQRARVAQTNAAYALEVLAIARDQLEACARAVAAMSASAISSRSLRRKSACPAAIRHRRDLTMPAEEIVHDVLVGSTTREQLEP